MGVTKNHFLQHQEQVVGLGLGTQGHPSPSYRKDFEAWKTEYFLGCSHSLRKKSGSASEDSFDFSNSNEDKELRYSLLQPCHQLSMKTLFVIKLTCNWLTCSNVSYNVSKCISNILLATGSRCAHSPFYIRYDNLFGKDKRKESSIRFVGLFPSEVTPIFPYYM